MHFWRILLDLDGTVAQNAGRRIAARQFGVNLSEEEYGASLPELLGLTEAEFWAWWHENQEEIYDKAEPLPGAAKLLQQMHAAGATIVVVTARRATAEAVTTAWLQRHGFPYDQMIFSADDKVAVAQANGLNLGFEDDPRNALALAEVMPMVLVENLKNRSLEIAHERVYRVTGWHEVPELLEQLGQKSA